jgi:hypothetical protein
MGIIPSENGSLFHEYFRLGNLSIYQQKQYIIIIIMTLV